MAAEDSRLTPEAVEDRRLDSVSRVVYDRLDRLDRRLTALLLGLTTALLALGYWNLTLTRNNSRQADAIQHQRFDATYTACTDSNHRHDVTVERLRVEIAHAIAQHPRRRREIESNLAGTILLIDALAPRTGSVGDKGAACRARANLLTH